MNKEIQKMKVESGIIQTLKYLNNKLIQANLNMEVAVLYLSILVDSANEKGIIFRPFFSYDLTDFDNYISFFKTYNIIFSAGGSNTYLYCDDIQAGYLEDFTLTNKDAIYILNSI